MICLDHNVWFLASFMVSLHHVIRIPFVVRFDHNIGLVLYCVTFVVRFNHNVWFFLGCAAVLQVKDWCCASFVSDLPGEKGYKSFHPSERPLTAVSSPGLVTRSGAVKNA